MLCLTSLWLRSNNLCNIYDHISLELTLAKVSDKLSSGIHRTPEKQSRNRIQRVKNLSQLPPFCGK